MRKQHLLFLFLAFYFNSWSQLIQSTDEGDKVFHSIGHKKLVGQIFKTSNAFQLKSIEVRITPDGLNGGLLGFDVYEISNGTSRYIATSDMSGYLVGTNVREFPEGVWLKENSEYAFVCVNNGINFFNVSASTNNAYPEGQAIQVNFKDFEGKPFDIPFERFQKLEKDLFFKINGSEEGVAVWDGYWTTLAQNIGHKTRIGQTFKTKSIGGKLKSISIQIRKKPGNGGVIAVDVYKMEGENPVYLGTSKFGPYYGRVNEYHFIEDITLEANSSYAFALKNNGKNFFHLASNQYNLYENGKAFKVNMNESGGYKGDLSKSQMEIYDNTDIYFKVKLDGDEIESPVKKAKNSLNIGEELLSEKTIQSENGKYQLRMGQDGNLCSYGLNEQTGTYTNYKWGTGTNGNFGAKLHFDQNGSIAIIDANGTKKWGSNTLATDDPMFSVAANKPVKLRFDDDGRLLLLNSQGAVLWTLDSNGQTIVKQETENEQYMTAKSKSELNDFFNSQGGRYKFSKHYIEALSTMIAVEDLVKSNQYSVAKQRLDKLWQAYPVGDQSWKYTTLIDKKLHTNVGHPTAYNSLRMLTDIVKFKLANANTNAELVAKLRVVLVGKSEGKMPTTIAEYEAGTGAMKVNTLDARLNANNHEIINESLSLFLNYVNAMTNGKLKVEVDYLSLPNYTAPVKVFKDGEKNRAGLNNYSDVLGAVSNAVREETDWWWIIYPSTEPLELIDLLKKDNSVSDHSFITGGIGSVGPSKPVFFINDTWLTEHPKHMGDGEVSYIERRAYMPQWLQHEFFHHLYRNYNGKWGDGLEGDSLALESESHIWQLKDQDGNPTDWPAGFEGLYECDYYQESLHKKMKNANPKLAYLLKPTLKPSQAILSSVSIDDFLNKRFDATEHVLKHGIQVNDYHKGTIIEQSGRYYWKNDASIEIEIEPDFGNGRFKNKGNVAGPEHDFIIEFKRLESGEFTNQIIGFKMGYNLFKFE